MKIEFDALVVGSGLAGSVVAEQLASDGKRILIIDKRSHIAGNCYDELDEHGVLVHRYGPHIFHTNSERIFKYLSKFTEWRDFEVKVLASIDGKLLPIPINRTTINQLYNLNLSEAEVAVFLDKVRERKSEIKTSEDLVLNSVGRDLYDKFFKNYIKKQWGRDASEISAEVAARIPTRTNDDDRYFTDTFQAIPSGGYTKMIESIHNHPNIQVKIKTSYSQIIKKIKVKHVVYTGPIDEYFDFIYGRLPYRSLNFGFEYLPNIPEFQSVAVVSYPNDNEYTRITEFKHITGQKHQGTTIVKEYPNSSGDPYYPVPNPINELIYKKYEKLADELEDVTFVGRLAEYRYYNMDQVVGSAITSARNILKKLNL